jgi:hypothetical protein
VSGHSSLAVQEALYAKLSDDSGIKALVGDPARVYDNVPQDTPYPYIEIGEDTALDGGTATEQGMDLTVMLHYWARDRGKRTVKLIAARVYELLHEQELVVESQSLVLCRFVFGDFLLDPDGVTRHGVARYRILTTQ